MGSHLLHTETHFQLLTSSHIHWIKKAMPLIVHFQQVPAIAQLNGPKNANTNMSSVMMESVRMHSEGWR